MTRTCILYIWIVLWFVQIIVEDMVKILDDDHRKCMNHDSHCPLPDKLFCFASGFSCTSLFGLNAESHQNTSAFNEQKASWLRSRAKGFKCSKWLSKHSQASGKNMTSPSQSSHSSHCLVVPSHLGVHWLPRCCYQEHCVL